MKMRKFRFLAIALLGASSMFLTSCEDDTDDPLAPKPNLEITVITSNNQTVVNDDVTVPEQTTLTFFINASKSGSSDLDEFQITQIGSIISNLDPTAKGYDYSPANGAVSLKNADDETYRDTLTIAGSSVVGTTTFQFELTNKDGQTTTRTIKVTVDNPVSLSKEVTGAFFHIQGTAKGSYNLITEEAVAVSVADVNKDMSNTDAAGVVFTGSWEAKNSTNFVKDNSFDYDNATEEAARTAYNGGTQGKSVTNPQVGDIYIAKLRGTDEYAVIKITVVDPTDTTGGSGNPGKIEFDFKKKS